mmetsp:Transcript_5467/g.9471  ORF Transcript_5467/g.9471 Transcript_5467/m.9471 type:complete len:218 (+) Transcript_5467:67-720(+)
MSSRKSLAISLLPLVILSLSLNTSSAGLLSALKGPIECVKQKDVALCDDLDDCNWCESTGLGTGCYPFKAAKLLPTRYFTCDKPVTAAAVKEEDVQGPIDCLMQKNGRDCDHRRECDWCESTGLGTGCYPHKAAKLLPTKYFTCDKLETAKAQVDAQAQTTTTNEGCDKLPEDSCIAPECIWCTSAAVGGGCYTPGEAKLLPSAIFKCKTAPSFAAY